jgi:hypothetical protein
MKECVKFVGCKVYSKNFMFTTELGANEINISEQIDIVHNSSVDNQ